LNKNPRQLGTASAHLAEQRLDLRELETKSLAMQA